MSWLGPTTFGRPHSVDTSPKVGLVRVVTVADQPPHPVGEGGLDDEVSPVRCQTAAPAGSG